MIAHLWTKGTAAPLEYIVLTMCRDVYHCRPSELRQENLLEMQKHIVCMNAEERVRKMRSK